MGLRADIMVDINDDAKDGGYRRVEVLTGPGRRRKWSEDDKARIVAETLRPGTVVADVARRWQVSSQQVFTWRREMRRAAVAPLSFVPVVAETPVRAPEAALPLPAPPSIEVGVAGAVLRVTPGTDVDLLTAVLRAIRASAA
ncbi:IS66-like element accessory protein TnpA [Siccirubricoccus sp. G192]|uniref:IS66-like element accessory protein TnpA n=2 Tax=Siccirubricoccus sp. G192 TaxID=2849651 RepID=UPI001C2CA6AB|nr:transposase [Siccirubricoccus sp. G192]MBV1795915.1 transposase [Siccirubricoccus sp. G192]MBV1796544.1 transposase [Siccirubricoccus sp. G192]